MAAHTEMPVEFASPDIGEADVAAVAATLRSGILARGPRAGAFESAFGHYVGRRHAIAVSSGTAALHLIVRSAKLAPGSEVLVPSFTFAATVNALLYERLTPVFVDIAPGTFGFDVDDARKKITARTRALVAVDLFGHPADWRGIRALAEAHDLRVFADACESLGARYGEERIGKQGIAAAFGFYPNKQITTGEGGMVVTDDDDIADACRRLANQGRADDAGSSLLHASLGYNYRMNEMSAALGESQLRRLDAFLRRRSEIAAHYHRLLDGHPQLRVPVEREGTQASWFAYVLTLDERVDRDAVGRQLALRGIATRAYFTPVHQQPYYRELAPQPPESLPVTERAGRSALALPFHGKLTEAQIERVVDELDRALAATTERRSP